MTGERRALTVRVYVLDREAGLCDVGRCTCAAVYLVQRFAAGARRGLGNWRALHRCHRHAVTLCERIEAPAGRPWCCWCDHPAVASLGAARDPACAHHVDQWAPTYTAAADRAATAERLGAALCPERLP